jgi:branched-chain amino acid transport system permease protein
MVAHATQAGTDTKTGVSGWSLSIAPRRGALSVVELIVLAACIVAALTMANRHGVDIMIRTFLWAGLALAWNIAGGYVGLISFGHAAFFGIGAYTSTILLLSYGISPWIGLFGGALLAAVAGALLTIVCARLRGPFFILSTLAAGEVTRIAALNWRSLTGGAEGLEIPAISSAADMVFANQWPYVGLVLSYMLLVFALSVWIERSRYGYYLFATRDNEDGASAIGINPRVTRVSAMALSAALTAIGGTLFVQYFLYLDPTHIISPDISFEFALICAIGGLGTASGPVFGALIIVPASELLRGWLAQSASGLYLVLYGLVVILVILYFPSGVSGAIARGWAALTKKKTG